jgi:hypothetical protein
MTGAVDTNLVPTAPCRQWMPCQFSAIERP